MGEIDDHSNETRHITGLQGYFLLTYKAELTSQSNKGKPNNAIFFFLSFNTSLEKENFRM